MTALAYNNRIPNFLKKAKRNVCDLATVHDFRGNELTPTHDSGGIDPISKRQVEGISSTARRYGNVKIVRKSKHSICALWKPRKHHSPETACKSPGNRMVLIGVNSTK